MRFSAAAAIGLLSCVGALLASPAQAAVINLQADLPGSGKGSTFCGAGNAVTLAIDKGGYTVVLSGGVDLGPDITFLPASASVLYGTSGTYGNGCAGQSGYQNPLTIEFFQSGTTNYLDVTNFFVDLYNGNTVAVDYTLADDLGNSATFNIGNNLSGGQQTFGFAAAGHTFTITAGAANGGCCDWDFFINNIGFNEALPWVVPEPGSLALLVSGALAGWATRRRRQAVA